MLEEFYYISVSYFCVVTKAIHILMIKLTDIFNFIVNFLYQCIIFIKCFFMFSKIQLVVYYQCYVLNGLATTKLYVIAP